MSSSQKLLSIQRRSNSSTFSSPQTSASILSNLNWRSKLPEVFIMYGSRTIQLPQFVPRITSVCPSRPSSFVPEMRTKLSASPA